MYPGNLAFFPADQCTVNIGEKQDNVLCWSFVFFVVGHFGEGWVWVCACFPHKPHHSVDRVASKCFGQPAVLADPTTDRGFFSQGTLFHGRRIGVRIVTHENRSREEWGSLGFFCVSNEDMQVWCILMWRQEGKQLDRGQSLPKQGLLGVRSLVHSHFPSLTDPLVLLTLVLVLVPLASLQTSQLFPPNTNLLRGTWTHYRQKGGRVI